MRSKNRVPAELVRMTLSAAASEMGVSRQRARQLEEQAFRKIRLVLLGDPVLRSLACETLELSAEELVAACGEGD